MRFFALPIVVLAAAGLSGCAKKPGLDSKEAVRQGVIDHLSKRPNLDFNQMQVDVTSVNFHGNQADAVVSFRPKGSAGVGNGMSMRYTLEQQGNRWVVKGRNDVAGSPHAGAGAMGGGMPGAPMGGNAPGGAMSPHPPSGGSSGTGMGSGLPQGHPPIGGANPAPPANPPGKK